MLSIYDLTVPALLRGFATLSHSLDQAEAHVAAHGLAPETILEARIAPDMLPFAAQIQRASDKAKGGIARLAAIPAPPYDDTEKSFDELRARIAKTVAFIESADTAQFDDAADRLVELRFRSVSGKLKGSVYLTQVLLPDFYFHIATAHGILRNLGVPLGKADYLGAPDYSAA